MSDFYFGGDEATAGGSAKRDVAHAGGLKKLVGVNLEEIDAREVNSIHLFDDEQGRAVYVRVGRFGPYLNGPCRRPMLPSPSCSVPTCPPT